ncbi:hypothetical protein JRI60_49890 [Archangium violaceum]|uniref:Ig-like domain-containing protein n=1 Tax=Archangium violaceum TaxID=83451 RepID=UPI0019503A91|nr:Ig-like domain-containing protein [Archangium violaceum]QRN96990.1 hypothetical protein JRI60_49890 [Archangium violaceum]
MFDTFSGSDSGASQVEFFVDGVSIGLGTAASPPYFYVTWDATGAALGAHTLTTIATDVHGNAATSSPVTIAVDHTSPTLAITSLSSGATFTGIAPLRVDTTDDVGVVWVNYYWDGVYLASVPPPFSVDWDVGAEARGSHTLEAVAVDAYEVFDTFSGEGWGRPRGCQRTRHAGLKPRNETGCPYESPSLSKDLELARRVHWA